jgi:hypothetical protein
LGCGAQNKGNSSELSDVYSGNLWAGKVTANSERSVRDGDICSKGFDMNRGDFRFDGWARQRAAYTNLCFEVWMHGVTDQENPDFWKLLDVKLHYRYEGVGSFATVHVNAFDRVGNNRRYVADLRNFDLFKVTSAPSDPSTYRVLSKSSDSSGRIWGSVESVMEIYITVNGHELRKHDGHSFHVKYEGNILLTN